MKKVPFPLTIVTECSLYPRLLFLQKHTLSEKEDIHVPDQIDEAIQSDIVQNSNDPQTSPDTRSPPIRYKTAKQNLEILDKGPFFLSEEQKTQSELKITPSNTEKSTPLLQNNTQNQQKRYQNLKPIFHPLE